MESIHPALQWVPWALCGYSGEIVKLNSDVDLIRAVHVNTMKAYKGSRGVASLILNLGSRWR
jgi:hypothetical protein